MSHRWVWAGVAGGALAIALAIGGCEKSSTSPVVTDAVSGTLRDPGGNPVPGAVVILESDGPRPDGLSLFTQVDSDGAGRFSFANLEAGAYIVGTRHAGLAVAVRVSVPRTDPVSLTLQPAGRLVGTAQYSDRTRHDGIAIYPPLAISGSMTDSTGAWAFEVVPVGTWRVVAEAFGSSDYRTDTATVVVQALQTTAAPPLVLARIVIVP